jgi:uncharacterized metal-binding protein
MHYSCASCGRYVCGKSGEQPRLEELPENCPVRNEEWKTAAKAAYDDPENRKIAAAAAATEHDGYCVWPRLQEVAEFCRRAGYKKLGLAFCTGLKREAAIVYRYYQQQGLEVVSAICQCGAISKEEVGIPETAKFNPGQHEPMCNPVGQAMIMNQAGTDFNVVLGLCVGHDSLFFKHAEAPCTVLAAKDRVLGHNPLAAVYLSQSYYKKLF